MTSRLSPTGYFSATNTPASITTLAQSGVNYMRDNGFDGIDIDWEFPTAAQKETYTALLVELRKQLDAQGSTDGRSYLLTIAAPAGPSNYENIDLAQIHPQLDWINLKHSLYCGFEQNHQFCCAALSREK